MSVGVGERVATFFGVHDDWRRPRAGLAKQDVWLAVGVAAIGLLGLELTRSIGAVDQTDAPVWSQWVAVLSGAALLLGRRRWPLLIAGLAATHMFLVGVLMPQVMIQVSLQLVYFLAILSGVAWARDRRLMLVVVGSIVVFMFTWIGWQFAIGSAVQAVLDDGSRERTGLVPPVPAAVGVTFLINALYFGGAAIGGGVSWRSARQRARLEDQAHTIRTQAARLRDQAVIDERLRIARELHDVVAHHISAMGIQAGAARRVLDRDPDAARVALTNVEQASRSATTQMRGLLGTLRAGDDDAATRTTDPDASDLAALLATQSASGLKVQFDVVEDSELAVARLPKEVGLSVYRTVQEALTNVRRHSTADNASVVVRVQECAQSAYAEVEIIDHGRPRRGTSGSGLGHLGIRERAASHRGDVEIGPRVGGGYRVRVRYPLGGEE